MKVQPKTITSKAGTTHYDISTKSVETIISNTRKVQENQIQKWIDEVNPGPFEILKRISEISSPHHSILSKIIPELENIVTSPQYLSELNNIGSIHYKDQSSSSINSDSSENNNLNPSKDGLQYINSSIKNNQSLQFTKDDKESDIQQILNYDPYLNPYSLSKSNQKKSQLHDILIETHDYSNSIIDKKEKIKELQKLLELKKKEKKQFEQKYENLQCLIKNEDFGAYEVMKKEKEELENIKNHDKNIKKKQKKQAEYSQIYGENRRLRDSIRQMTKDINENHQFQLSFAHDISMKKIEMESIKKYGEEPK